MSKDFKALYSGYKFDDLQKSNPLQCALLRDSLFSNRDDKKTIELNVLKFCSELPSGTLSIRMGSKRKLSSDFPPTIASTSKFGEILDLADDLSMTTSAALRRKAPEPVPVVQQRSITPNNVIEDQRPPTDPKKAGQFSTAKQQFLAEGGKFDTVTEKTSGAGLINRPITKSSSNGKDAASTLPPELQHCDKALVERIEADIIHNGQHVTFEDISGLEFAKKCVTEIICWPMSRPDLFQGLRSLPRGLLLFGPPGTGKTLIGKAIAHQSGATFFSISASSLMSKWIGEGEKTVRTLFEVAAYRQPSVVFIDEVDSLLCQRSGEENEASRRIKTEFMVQLDGAGTSQSDRIVIVGATNRPEELDEAVRRRFVKRIYIPLPDDESRRQLLLSLLKNVSHSLTSEDIEFLVLKTSGFSGADIRSLCTEAAMGPVREVATQQRGNLMSITANEVPAISKEHFEGALEAVLPTVSPDDLQRYVDWNATYGSFRRMV